MESAMKQKKTAESTKQSPLAKTKAWIRTHPRRTLAFTGAVIIVVFLTTFIVRTALPIFPSYVAKNQQVNQPFSLSLSQNIRTIDTAKISISPAVKGVWKTEPGSMFAADKLVFTPKEDFTVNTTYRVKLPSVQRIAFGETAVPEVAFTTEAAPSVETRGVAALTNGQTIAADYQFDATLTSANKNLRHLVLRTTPAVEFETSNKADQTWSWKPKGLLPQGSPLEIELYDEKNHVSLYKQSVKIADEPQVTSPAERTRLTAQSPILISFSQPIAESSRGAVHIDTEGTGTWKSPSEYEFAPKGLKPGATYHYTVDAGLRSDAGGVLHEAASGSFSTIGAVVVTGASPEGRGLSQASQTVSFTFDQPVDHGSAQSKFSISSGTVRGFSWKGNTMYVSVSDLGYQQTVTARVEAGVANAGFGLPSATFYTHSFTTETRSVRLNVPHFRQQHSATCSAASLRMALAYRGVGSDEMGLVHAMGYAPRDRQGDVWDDSGVMFVGSVDGSIAAGTGAGPDAPPIAKAARAYGRSAQDFSGISAGWIAQQIYNGNPVLMFGAYKPTGTTSWKTPSGGTIVMNLTGHVTVVTGVVGEPSSPIGFWVNDPLGGGGVYWSAGAVAANIARDPGRQAVVVY